MVYGIGSSLINMTLFNAVYKKHVTKFNADFQPQPSQSPTNSGGGINYEQLQSAMEWNSTVQNLGQRSRTLFEKAFGLQKISEGLIANSSNGLQATSSTSAVSASVTSDAVEGSFTVDVSQIATQSTQLSKLFSSTDTFSSLTKNAKIAAGYRTSFILRDDGKVYAFGENSYGQLGIGNNTHMASPTLISGLSNITEIDAGKSHNLAVDLNGNVYSWGDNTSGKLGDGTTTDSPSPIQVNNLTDVVDVEAGGNHSLALKSDGTVWSWGHNANGELGNNLTTHEYNPTQVLYLTNIKKIEAGSNHSIALADDGTVYGWGSQLYGQLGDGATSANQLTAKAIMTDVKDVVAQTNNTYILKNDGTVWGAGDNGFGQTSGDGTTSQTDGTLNQISGLSNIEEIFTGGSILYARDINGDTWVLGDNTGNFGDGTTTDSLTPKLVTELNGVDSIFSHDGHTLAIDSQGNVTAMGLNTYGELGNGNTGNQDGSASLNEQPSLASVLGGDLGTATFDATNNTNQVFTITSTIDSTKTMSIDVTALNISPDATIDTALNTISNEINNQANLTGMDITSSVITDGFGNVHLDIHSKSTGSTSDFAISNGGSFIQSNTLSQTVNNGSYSAETVGQTFTVQEDGYIDSATISLSLANSSNLTMRLLDSDGNVIHSGNVSGSYGDFTLNMEPYQVKTGETYSIEIDTMGINSVAVDNNNNYNGGSLYSYDALGNKSTQASVDAVFNIIFAKPDSTIADDLGLTNLSTHSQGTDSQYAINSGTIQTSSTNNTSYNGVELTFNNVTTTTATINISKNSSSQLNNAGYKEIVDFFGELNNTTMFLNRSSEFMHDDLEKQINNFMDSNSNTLSSIGITKNENGLYDINQTVLTDSINNNFTTVDTLFNDSDNGISPYFQSLMIEVSKNPMSFTVDSPYQNSINQTY